MALEHLDLRIAGDPTDHGAVRRVAQAAGSTFGQGDSRQCCDPGKQAAGGQIRRA